jgi:hypothetical protein
VVWSNTLARKMWESNIPFRALPEVSPLALIHPLPKRGATSLRVGYGSVQKSQSSKNLLRRASSVWWGVLLILAGISGGVPLLAAVSVNLVIAWLVVAAGMVHLINAQHSYRAGIATLRLTLGPDQAEGDNPAGDNYCSSHS